MAGQKLVIPGVKSPCGACCPERRENCRESCRKWKAFELQKQLVYARRKRAFEASYKIKAPQRYADEMMRKRNSK